MAVGVLVVVLVGIGVLVLVHVWVVGRALRRTLRLRTSQKGHGKGLSQPELQKLPSFEVGGAAASGAAEGRDTDCAVCLETFERGEKCRMLPQCKHIFHVKCVDTWLSKIPICPICRTNVGPRGSGGAKDVATSQDAAQSCSARVRCEMMDVPALMSRQMLISEPASDDGPRLPMSSSVVVEVDLMV
eukprot:Gb_36232 [translate_table: standard]